MSTRSAARKAEPWSSFLYSDPEGFQVKTVQFANGATGRGLFANRSFDDKEFCSLTGYREVQQKRQTSTM